VRHLSVIDKDMKFGRMLKNISIGTVGSAASTRPAPGILSSSSEIPTSLFQAHFPDQGFSGDIPVDEPKKSPRLFNTSGDLPASPSLPTRKGAVILSEKSMSVHDDKPSQILTDWIASFSGSDQQIVVEAIRHYLQTLDPSAQPIPVGAVTLRDDQAALILKICTSSRHDPLDVAHQLAMAEIQYNPNNPEAQARRQRASLHLDARHQLPSKKDSGSSSAEGGSNPIDNMVPGLKTGSGPSQSQSQR
jgi:hypothetical protein